jgi:hypothetical protein
MWIHIRTEENSQIWRKCMDILYRVLSMPEMWVYSPQEVKRNDVKDA